MTDDATDRMVEVAARAAATVVREMKKALGDFVTVDVDVIGAHDDWAVVQVLLQHVCNGSPETIAIALTASSDIGCFMIRIMRERKYLPADIREHLSRVRRLAGVGNAFLFHDTLCVDVDKECIRRHASEEEPCRILFGQAVRN